MSVDNFFKEIDGELDAMQKKQISQQERVNNHKADVQRFVEETIPHLEEYKRNLEKRGVDVKFEHSPKHLKFLMFYTDGGHLGFQLIHDYKINMYKIQGNFTNDDGRNFISEGADFDRDQMWTWSGFEDYVQKNIKDFFFYSERHGGYVKKA